jgi:hypothetical protein
MFAKENTECLLVVCILYRESRVLHVFQLNESLLRGLSVQTLAYNKAFFRRQQIT